MRQHSRLAIPLLAAAVTMGPLALAASATQPADGSVLAPLHLADGRTSAASGPRTYMVLLKDKPSVARASASGRTTIAQTTVAAAERAREDGAQVHKTLTGLGAYTATLDPARLAEVRKDPEVLMVSEPTIKKASEVTWGLDRVDQAKLPLDSAFAPQGDGAGVHAYVIDTGINTGHQEFTGRTAEGFNAMGDSQGPEDCNGHGTHVAGTIAGTTYGVAKKATVVPVRVLGCDGSSTGTSVEDGIDWVIKNAKKPAVANMSLGGSADAGLDAAVRRLGQAGILTAVAAGNDTTDACNVSPAREASAITVGSTTRTDAASTFSNYGSCLDVYAPGSDITSAWKGGPTATNTISGTSMATPHVAGALALYAQKNSGATQADAVKAIVETSTKDVVTGTNGSANRLLFVNGFGGGSPAPAPAPTTPAPTPTTPVPSPTAPAPTVPAPTTPAPSPTTTNPAPTPTTPAPKGCSGYRMTFQRSLVQGRDAREPYESYFSVRGERLQKSCLQGPEGSNFDLQLQRWTGMTWADVAKADGPTSHEELEFQGPAGAYRYRVQATNGNGAYTLGVSFN